MLAHAFRGSKFASGVRELKADAFFDSDEEELGVNPWSFNGERSKSASASGGHVVSPAKPSGMEAQRQSGLSMVSTECPSSFDDRSPGASMGFQDLARTPPPAPDAHGLADLKLMSTLAQRSMKLSRAIACSSSSIAQPLGTQFSAPPGLDAMRLAAMPQASARQAPGLPQASAFLAPMLPQSPAPQTPMPPQAVSHMASGPPGSWFHGPQATQRLDGPAAAALAHRQRHATFGTVGGAPPPPPTPPQLPAPSPAGQPGSQCLSVGSLLHSTGACTPCKFHRCNRGCREGANCNLCHFPHEELTYSGIRRRMRLKTQAAMRERACQLLSVYPGRGALSSGYPMLP